MDAERKIIREKLDILEGDLKEIIEKFMRENSHRQSHNLGIEVELEHFYIEGQELPISSTANVSAHINFKI